jgi:Uma2 family endonuclease
MATHPEWKDPPLGGRMSEQEFHALEDAFPDIRYEYIDGIAYMMAGGTIAHDQINQNLLFAFRALIDSGPCRGRGPNMQTLLGTKKSGKKRYVYPDVVVSCKQEDFQPGSILLESPRLVIEVLSLSTERKDRSAKFKAYRACPTIQEIVFIDQFTQTVEVVRRNGEDGETWSFISPENGIVEFASINCLLKMEEIYWEVQLAKPVVEE